jgi:hypothetical protein
MCLQYTQYQELQIARTPSGISTPQQPAKESSGAAVTQASSGSPEQRTKRGTNESHSSIAAAVRSPAQAALTKDDSKITRLRGNSADGPYQFGSVGSSGSAFGRLGTLVRVSIAHSQVRPFSFFPKAVAPTPEQRRGMEGRTGAGWMET